MKKTLFLLALFLLTPFAFAQTFNDVASNHWAYPYAEDLVEQGIIDDAYLFHPERKLARVELVKIMVLATTGILEDQIPYDPSFPDIDREQWFYPYVETAKITGLIKGYPDGLFRPGQTVNRAEATKIIVRGMGLPTNYGKKVKFRDYSPEAWFHQYVSTAFNTEIVQGEVNSRGVKQMMFHPEREVSRAEMSKMASRGLSVSAAF